MSAPTPPSAEDLANLAVHANEHAQQAVNEDNPDLGVSLSLEGTIAIAASALVAALDRNTAEVGEISLVLHKVVSALNSLIEAVRDAGNVS